MESGDGINQSNKEVIYFDDSRSRGDDSIVKGHSFDEDVEYAKDRESILKKHADTSSGDIKL